MLSADSMVGAADTTLDLAAYRDAMARFPTGVAIVTTQDENGTPYGFTANSLCSVSLHPPLLLVCLARTAKSFPVFDRSPRFAVSILGSHHTEVAWRFAGRSPDKFGAGGFETTAGGATVLHDALSVLECRVHSRQPAGDHVILLGEVEAVRVAGRTDPAVYFDRGFHHLDRHPPGPVGGVPAVG
ncbi:flavin reductase family protein [Krasilnikovia sp. MM14-A1259]|uniref:flavin reductase family protein n=1 Tax=Krasilnikovia sp. MM14-A1259 TaxID=3373539 RepID=UPI0037F94A42